MKKNKFAVLLLALFSTWKVFAASDPVSWALTPATGFPVTSIGNQSTVQYTLTNRLPFPVVIYTRYNITGSNYKVHDGCHQTQLAFQASCVITVSFQPISPGTSSFQLIYQYNKNVIPLPPILGRAPVTPAALTGMITDLPPTFFIGNRPDFTATFTNNTNHSLTGCTTPPTFTVTGAASPGVVVLPQSNNCLGTLAPHESCTYVGRLSNVNRTGQLNLTGFMRCASPSPVVAQPVATSIVQSGSGCVVHATAELPPPSTTYVHSDNVVRFKVENECNTGVSLSNLNIRVSGVLARVTKSSSLFGACGSSLAAGRDCYLYASIIPQSAGVETILATGSYTVGARTQSFTASTDAVVKILPYTQSHTINFINQCPFPVWYGLEPGSEGPDPTPNPSPNAYKLAQQTPGARPVVKSLVITQAYNGAFLGRTMCRVQGSRFICTTSDCNSSSLTGKCTTSAQPPYTKIEEVFFAPTSSPPFQGTYDISILNGFSIAAEMKALGPLTNANAPFQCTGAGAPIPAYPTVLGACSWAFNPPANAQPQFLRFVTNTPRNCSSCIAGEVCGLSFINNDPNQNITQNCGTLIGYWSVLQLCSGLTYVGFTPTPTTAYQCNNPLPASKYGAGFTFSDLYSCPAPSFQSCYNSSSSACCGVRDWNQSPYITAQGSNSVGTNPDWTGQSSLMNVPPLTAIQWSKIGCPTAYTYTYDDPSSSFVCDTNSQGQQVKMNFDIVFCPGGLVTR